MQIIQSFITSQETIYVIIRVAAILALTFFAAKVFIVLAKHTAKQNKIHIKFLRNIVIMFIYTVGVFIALSEIPKFETGFQAILAGSGIVALTIGLAAQESLGNTINGMFISMFRPFEVGDRIHLINASITGFVEDITLRHTVMRTFINSRVIIPNSVINKELIENSNYWGVQASSFIDATVTYDSDLELARKIMADVISTHKDFVDTRPSEAREGPAVKVFVRALSWYGVDLRASMWTETVSNNFEACSDARRQIKLEFDKHGIKIASYKGSDPNVLPPA